MGIMPLGQVMDIVDDLEKSAMDIFDRIYE
jgi:hypothetical protein